MTLADAINAYCTSLAANARSSLTVAAYRRDLTAMANHAHVGPAMPAESMGHSHVERWLADLAATPLPDGTPRSPSTVNRAKAAARSFGAWLATAGIAARDPAATIRIQRTQRTSPNVLADSDRKRLVREVHARSGRAAPRDAMMLDLLLGTGIRLAELTGLDCSAVDLDRCTITIRAKGNRIETRFMHSELRRSLRAYLRWRRDQASESPALFLSNRGRRISDRQVQARFAVWLRWAGIAPAGLSIHSLRHTFGTRLYRRTHDLVLVGKAMGHRTTEATRVYVHDDAAALEEALEALGR